uniref:imidazolonepropionase n=1 Tax=Flavobacterium sp. TaxID=239 RepID=UPI00404ADC65
MKTIFINIKSLIQIREKSETKLKGIAMATLPSLENAFLVLEHDEIVDFGTMENCPVIETNANVVDATDRYVMPTWVDSHTHLVFSNSREQEFVDRINGLTYEEIANRGGGILNSAAHINEISESDLYDLSAIRLEDVMRLGTGAIEIKSGYGLTVDGELKMLRVIKKLAANYPITIKSTFLGAHAFPTEFKNNHAGYIDLICNEMIPKVAAEQLADYIDAFLETGYFSVAETERIVNEGKKYGLIPKIHVNQFTTIGGIEACVNFGALSVDHLEVLNDADILALQKSETMPVALPTCSFFIDIPYTPARQLLDAGLPLAIASDFNPGTTPTGNMNLVVAMACIKMRITPEEAINASTLNGAYAMGISDSHGSITKGKKASVILTKKISSIYQIPYAFGSNLIENVWINGKKVS